MTTLISGGSGFLGVNMAASLAAQGEDVVITSRRRDHPQVAAVTAAHDRVIAVPLELTSAHEVHDLFARFKFDRVLHAATTHTFAATRAAVAANYMMLLNCLEGARISGVRRFVLASSMSVYRGLPGPWREDVSFPVDIADAGAWVSSPGRGATTVQWIREFEVTVKRVEEFLALDYGLPMNSWDLAPSLPGNDGQLEVVALRHPWLAGPGYTSMYNPVACHVHVAAGRDRSLLENRELMSFASVAYMPDCVDVLNLLLSAESLPHRIYNVKTFANTGREILEALYRVVPEAEARIGIDPATADDHNTGEDVDISRIAADLDWRPAFDLDSALAHYVEWLGSHEY